MENWYLKLKITILKIIFLYKTYLEFDKQKRRVDDFFGNPISSATTIGEQYPACENKTKIGHSYIWPGWSKEKGEADYCLEQMGGWMNYVTMQGSKDLLNKNGIDMDFNAAFNNFDSITHEFIIPDGQTNRPITFGDAYQLQTYENNVVYGKISVGQLCQIIDYILAGEETFVYGENNKEYKTTPTKIDINHDPLTGERCTDKDIQPSRYLCAPIQFWGVAFNVDRSEEKEDGKIVRRYKLHYDEKDGKKIPSIQIYDPKSLTNDIANPSSWTPAEEFLNNNKLISILMSSFLYNGSNYQGTMFQPYTQFNGEVTIFDFFVRDAIIAFCEGQGHQTVGYDLLKDATHKTMTIN